MEQIAILGALLLVLAAIEGFHAWRRRRRRREEELRHVTGAREWWGRR